MPKDKSDKKQAGSPERRARSISESTTARLSIYLRCLNLLERAGVETISSKGLAEQFHLNSALIRKDLAYFGEFGVRGVGYNVRELRDHLVHILGLDRELRLAIVGAGNLGQALADYRGFNSEGCHIVAMFDNAPAKVGSHTRGGVPVHHVEQMESVVQEERVNIVILAIPAGEAQAILDRLAASGVRAILNFVPDRLRVDEGVFIRNVDLKIQLEGLAFHLAQLRNAES
jgi:redox-sensing transcriptional repressor